MANAKTKTANCVNKVKVKLPRIGGRDEAVWLSVGEESWRIRRGFEVEIPDYAYDLICNSERAEDIAVAFKEAKENG